MDASVSELLILLGQKEVEIFLLHKKFAAISEEIKRLREAVKPEPNLQDPGDAG